MATGSAGTLVVAGPSRDQTTETVTATQASKEGARPERSCSSDTGLFLFQTSRRKFPRPPVPEKKKVAATMQQIEGGFDGGYGGSGAGGGGGYMQSPGGFGSPAPTQGEKKSRSRAQQIVPCTVSQLLSASQSDEVFRIGEVELSQVTVVGIVRHAEKAPTNILYKVDDMTAAPMDVRQWVDTDEASCENMVVPPGSYVKVAGHLRSFQNKKSVVAFKITPIEDMNEFVSHMLEVVQSHMILNSQGAQTGGGSSHALSTPGHMGMTDTSGGSFNGGNSMQTNGLTAHQSQILNLIKSCRGTEGMAFDELRKRLNGMNVNTIKQAVEFLSNEGHIYSTVDDEHYKSTDGD